MSFSTLGNGATQRPPAQSLPQTNSHSQSSHNRPSTHSPSTTPTVSRESSRAPSAPPTRKRKSRTRAPSPRLPPPEIPLPDPSEPVPANWLRSQSALLGHAGLVGGVNTATLSTRHAQGTSSSNPIVIDDNDIHSSRRPLFIAPPKPPTPQIPPPSTQEIVQILIKQKEVFPILQDLLKLVAHGSAKAFIVTSSSASASQSADKNEPPKKKRKLDSVPAGAADWDVPFPFEQGEGPRRYLTDWEKDRQKQLIGQLVSLIKAASRKAAFRKQLREQHRQKELMKEIEHAQPKVRGHYRPKAALYGQVVPGKVFTDASNGSIAVGGQPSSQTSNSCASANPTASASLTPFDQLLSSILAAAPSDDFSDATDQDTSSVASTSHQPTPELDDGLMDTWMSLLQSFPLHDSASSSLDGSVCPSPFSDLSMDFNLTSASSSSTSGVDNILFPESSSQPSMSGSFSSGHILPDPSSHFAADSSSMSSQNLPEFSLDSLGVGLDDAPVTADALDLLHFHQEAQAQSQQTMPTLPNNLPDSMIDPELLALSINPNISSQADVSSMTSACGSPMPSMASMSSYGDFDVPMTPRSATGDLASPVIANPSNEVGDLGISGMMPGGVLVGFRRDRMADDAQVQGEGTMSKGKGKEKEVEVASVLPALLSHLPRTLTGSREAKKLKSEKKELLRRAKERRQQLAEEIVKTRMQLWETTIEHGVLMNIAQYYSSVR